MNRRRASSRRRFRSNDLLVPDCKQTRRVDASSFWFITPLVNASRQSSVFGKNLKPGDE